MDIKKFFYFLLLIIFSNKTINCGSSPCFEYSCDECETQEYGTCTKCRSGFTLVDGKCPCNDPTCALCTSGLAGLHLCVLCKNGYYRFNYDCYCLINNCEQCSDNSCLKCRTGYFYNSTSNECEILEDENKILCYDENCESCFSEEKGACEYCKDGYTERKGECIELPILDINNTCPDRYYRSGDRCLEICSGVECNEVYEDNDNYYSCPSNKCLICVGNELKIWSECDNSDICSEMDGCLNCITSDECVVCSQGYYLLGGECLKCPDGCSSCSNNYTCDFCMSGYELNSDKECYLTYNFDFNTNVYSTFKTFLIFNFYPEELVQKEDPTEKPTEVDSKEITDSSSLFQSTKLSSTISTDTSKYTEIEDISDIDSPTDINKDLKIENKSISEIMECDKNCIKCFDNIGKCIECDTLYSLKENKCIKQCTDEKCLDCSIKNDKEYCNKCEDGYQPSNEKCSLICSIENCSKCSLSNNKEICSQCKTGYRLKNNKCLVQCKEENCLDCSDDGKNCTECDEDKKLIDGKCAFQSSFCSQHFLYCNYCIGNEKCVECIKGYKIDKTGKTCQKNSNYLSIIFTILAIAIIIIGIISYCIFQKRKRELRREIRRMRMSGGNSINVYRERNIDRLNVSGSSRSVMNKEDLGDEFELQKRKMEKGNQMCQYCKKKPGKFKCDCGCLVCKEHSTLKNQEGDGEKYKVCFVCDKIVKKVTPIKYPCHICFGNKAAVAHFKCGCALEVCKNCYIKCKMGNNKCPGCRAII